MFRLFQFYQNCMKKFDCAIRNFFIVDQWCVLSSSVLRNIYTNIIFNENMFELAINKLK